MTTSPLPNQPEPATDGSALYLDFVEKELAAERDRRTRIDQRGLAIIATSGTLATLLLGIATALVGRDTTLGVDGWVVGGILLALAAFTTSALLALRATGLPEYKVLSIDAYRSLRDEAFAKTEQQTRRTIAAIHRKTMDSLRELNNGKAQGIQWALTFQVVAVISLASMIGVVAVRYVS